MIFFPTRSSVMRTGRAESSDTTKSFIIPGAVQTGLNRVITADRLHYGIIWLPTPLLVTSLMIDIVTAAAGNIRIGLYSADVNWQPVGGPLADSGDISSGTTGLKTYTPSTPIYLPAGRYLTAMHCSAAPTVRSHRGLVESSIDAAMGSNLFPQFFYISTAYAAFATPGVAWTTTVGSSSSSETPVSLGVAG